MEKLKRIAIAGLVVFSGTLSILLVKELSADALAMLLGVGCGVLASLPLAVALLLWSGRSAERDKPRGGREGNAPPVIIVSSGGQPASLPWPGMPTWLPSAGNLEDETGSQFRILGEPGEEQGTGWWRGSRLASDTWVSEGGVGW
ncbi:MAG: hypothetical protein ACUVXG_04200 [Anaerolineae bacterium]